MDKKTKRNKKNIINKQNNKRYTYYLPYDNLYIIGDNTTSYIESDAFQGNQEIKNVVLKSGIKGVGMNTFKDSAIETIQFTDEIDGFGYGSLESCKNLREITLPASMLSNVKILYAPCYNDSAATKFRLSNMLGKNANDLEHILVKFVDSKGKVVKEWNREKYDQFQYEKSLSSHPKSYLSDNAKENMKKLGNTNTPSSRSSRPISPNLSRKVSPIRFVHSH